MARAEEMTADYQGQKTAVDWLEGFARRSQEALAMRAAEKKIAPPPDEKALIAALARKDHTEYDRVRSGLAETLGMRVGTLDEKVEALRRKLEADDQTDNLPHWQVEPWPEPVNGAELLDSIKRVFRRYIVLPKDADIALALWILHAWTMDAGDISPFMVLMSPTKRCGKTSTLILLYFLRRSPSARLISPRPRSFVISRRFDRRSLSTKPTRSLRTMRSFVVS
jgi:putative DNA primase/helicase